MGNHMDDIDNILNGETPEPIAEAVEAAEPEATAEAQPETAERPRGPDGKFIPKGETEDAPPASSEVFEGKATLAERRKRQEAEQRIAALEAQLQQISNPPQPAPDMFENPEGWQNHFGGQIAQTAVQQATINSKLEMSEMLARDKFDDFDDMKTAFMELAQENPTLAQQALADSHPWRKAYQIAKTHSTMQQVGATDVDSLRASIRAEIEAELKAKPQPAIPTSLAGAQSGRGTSGVWNPPTIDEILRG
jgi:hypothetical protein